MFKRKKQRESDSNTDPDYNPDDIPDLPEVTPDDFPDLPKVTSDENNKKMEDIQAQLQSLTAKLKASEEWQRENEKKIANLNNSLSEFQINTTPTEYVDIQTVIDDPDKIQLDPYKCIPEFSGNKNQYRSWREQVLRRMRMISQYKTHSRYEAALGIIRAKITGAASDILINNNTAYNIEAIIDRLDFSYADQRPLYVVEAELTAIKQGNKSLQDYYDCINQALNTVITKIVMTYKKEDEQKSLITEMQLKGIRTFIMGLNSSMMRSTLYGHAPKTLAKAYAIAQTVYYDSQHLHLEKIREQSKPHSQVQHQAKRNPNFDYNKSQQHQQSPQRNGNGKPEPMEVDNSARFKQTTNWQQNKPINGQKREFESSRQHVQQPNKLQKINVNQHDENQHDENPPEENTDEICETIPDDLASNVSDESTTQQCNSFLVASGACHA